MDDATLDSLLAALAATPGNLALRRVIARALAEREQRERALEILTGDDPQALEAEDHLLVADLALATGAAERALEHAAGNSPEALIRQARAFAALDRQTEGRAAYDSAVAANPALEDRGLKQRLGATVRTFPKVAPTATDQRGRPKLAVISNDDTDTSEVKRLLVPELERVTFADVGGLDDIKKQIHKRIILPFQKPSLFARFKRRAGGGILLYGPPGCGKTLLARATAGECGAAFFSVAINDILDMYIGESERKLHAIFEQAREKAPSVLFFDELEALGGRREYTRESTSSKLVSQFLTEMDGFAQGNHGVLILAATNVPWAIDPAFRRPGRFDRVLFVPPPDRPARAAILDLLLADRPTAGGIDTDGLAAATSGFSGADLGNLVETASDEAIEASLERGAEVPIGPQHLKAAKAEVKPTTLEWLTTARNYARYANEGGQYDEVLAFLKAHGKG
jgi:transitional endoplasmic reticulum ATPase